jgi:hypothetical protein
MEDIESVLAELGIDFDTRNNEALALCPMHQEITGREDRSPSWWINLDTGAHMCFSCHYKGNLAQLVCDVLGFYTDLWGKKDYDYAAANSWLASTIEISPDKMADILTRIREYREVYYKPVAMSEARLAIFIEPPAEELAKRSIDSNAARYYGILWNDVRKEWILPVRDARSNILLGWQEKGTIERTFRNKPVGIKMSTTLFGYATLSDGDVVLVESPLDCARMHSAGVKNVVAICGSNINEEQFKLIRYADRIIAAFDNPKLDNAGKSASNSIHKLAIKYGANLLFFNYGETGKKDPGDLTDNEIVWGLAHAQSSLLGEKAYV